MQKSLIKHLNFLLIVVFNFEHLFFNQRHILTKIKKDLFKTIQLFIFDSSLFIISWVFVFDLDLVQRDAEFNKVILFLSLFVQLYLISHISKFLAIPYNISIIFEADILENELYFFMSPKVVHIFNHFITNYNPIPAFLPNRKPAFIHKILVLENEVFRNRDGTSPIISLFLFYNTSIQVNSIADSMFQFPNYSQFPTMNTVCP